MTEGSNKSLYDEAAQLSHQNGFDDSYRLHQIYDKAVQMVQEMGHENFNHCIIEKDGVIGFDVMCAFTPSRYGPVKNVLQAQFSFPFYNKRHDFKELILNKGIETFFQTLKKIVREAMDSEKMSNTEK